MFLVFQLALRCKNYPQNSALGTGSVQVWPQVKQARSFPAPRHRYKLFYACYQLDIFSQTARNISSYHNLEVF